jgi:short-subunit dehydrogenase
MHTSLARTLQLLLILIATVLLAGCATSGRLSEQEQAGVAGKTYVVTGASSGFGRGVALRLGGLHANVVLAARRTAELEKVAAEVTAAGGKALVVTTDVADPVQVERLAAEAIGRFGRIDVWINNAGVGAIGRFDNIPLADHARLIDVNLKGVIYGSHVALRRFYRQQAGVLVNIGSIESEEPMAYHASYSASKAGVLSLGRALNEELRLARMQAISVATVMPWAADTPFFEHAANYSGGTPRMPAMDDPQKVVNAIVWISLHPQEELSVGWKAKLTYAGHRIAPDINETVSANIAKRWQFDTAPPAPATSGTLHQAMPGGTGIDGGVRQRMEREDEARKDRSNSQ